MLPHEGGVQVIGLVGPLLGPEKDGLYHLPGNHFKGLAVPFIQGEKQPRQHGEHHKERRRAGGDAAPEQEKSGTPMKSAPLKQTSCRFVSPNSIFDFTFVKSFGTVTNAKV